MHAESAPVANSTATVEQLLSRLDTLADPSTWRDGTSILDYFDEFAAWEGGQVATIVDVTFKIASEATADGSRTVIDLLHELNQAVSTGTLGSLRLPAGQDVFDSLVMPCPAGTYQEPTEGCVPCRPASSPRRVRMPASPAPCGTAIESVVGLLGRTGVLALPGWSWPNTRV